MTTSDINCHNFSFYTIITTFIYQQPIRLQLALAINLVTIDIHKQQTRPQLTYINSRLSLLNLKHQHWLYSQYEKSFMRPIPWHNTHTLIIQRVSWANPTKEVQFHLIYKSVGSGLPLGFAKSNVLKDFAHSSII